MHCLHRVRVFAHVKERFRIYSWINLELRVKSLILAPLKSRCSSQHSTAHTLCNNNVFRYFINFDVLRPHSSVSPHNYCQRLHWFNLSLMWMKVEVRQWLCENTLHSLTASNPGRMSTKKKTRWVSFQSIFALMC